MKVAAFTDEINREDPVRTLPVGRVPRAPDAELETFGVRVRDAGLAVSGVVADPPVEAQTAQVHGCRLDLENEAVCRGHTGAEAAVETHTSAAPVGAEPPVDAGQALSPLEANSLRNQRCLRALLD